MCDNHRHLGTKATTSYAGRNFSQELETQDSQLQKLSEKREQIVKDLSEEIAYLFTQNNDLRNQLGQPQLDSLEVDTSEEALLKMIEILREEQSSLTNQLPVQASDQEDKSEKIVDSVDGVESSTIEQEKEEKPVVADTPAKKKFWNFLKRNK